jgi:hypothetical protein
MAAPAGDFVPLLPQPDYRRIHQLHLDIAEQIGRFQNWVPPVVHQQLEQQQQQIQQIQQELKQQQQQQLRQQLLQQQQELRQQQQELQQLREMFAAIRVQPDGV